MIAANVEGVDFIVANTDAQALNAVAGQRRIQLGPQITEGWVRDRGPRSARRRRKRRSFQVERRWKARICASSQPAWAAAPALVRLRSSPRRRATCGILTVGVVTKPFTFEGKRRMRSADAGIEELQKHVDTLIVIPNQNLFLIANPNTTFKEAFQMADEVLAAGRARHHRPDGHARPHQPRLSPTFVR
jgi:cell division protein FtsZ